MKKKDYFIDLFSFLVFILNPIVSLPFILVGLFKRTRYSVYLYSLLVAFISFMYLPTIEMDKARHMEFYNLSSSLNLKEFFVMNFEGSPDFLFGLILFICSKISISFHFTVFGITFLSVFLVLKSYFSVYDRYIGSNEYMFLVVPLFVFSFSYIDLISGIRYTLAISFIFYGFCQSFLFKKKSSWLWFFLGILTHFSVLLFALIYFFSRFIENINVKYLRLLLFISLIFVFLPRDNVFMLFQSLGLDGVINHKIDAYLNIQYETKIVSFGEKFIAFFNSLWIYILTGYLLIIRDKKSYYVKILLLSLIVTNVFISFPIIYNRYALFLKLLLVIYFIVENISKNSLKMPFLIVLIFCIISLNQIIVMREGFTPLINLDLIENNFINQLFENNFSYNKIK